MAGGKERARRVPERETSDTQSLKSKRGRKAAMGGGVVGRGGHKRMREKKRGKKNNRIKQRPSTTAQRASRVSRTAGRNVDPPSKPFTERNNCAYTRTRAVRTESVCREYL